MNYIVFDLEFNQNVSSLQNLDIRSSHYPFEIIQIGAVKLDINLNVVASFNRYIKPSIYKSILPFITELTGITTEQLVKEESFSEIYNEFVEFIDATNSIFCVWGMSDMKEIFKNAEYHELNTKLLPRMFINLQPYVTLYLNFPQKKLIRLQDAVELLNIPIQYDFHNALYDAYYTSEIFKKIHKLSIQPKIYDTSCVKIRPRQRKKIIDIERLLKQFEKMYSREITEEEKEMIILAYKMGKTNQFIK